MFTYNLCRWLTRLAAVGGRRCWMVITSLKGKRSQGVGGPGVGPRGPCQHAQYSTGIYIRKLFTSAHDEICQDFVSSAARRSFSAVSLSLVFSSFLLISFLWFHLLLLPTKCFISVLTFLPHSPTRGTHNVKKVALFSRIRPSPEAVRNYI